MSEGESGAMIQKGIVWMERGIRPRCAALGIRARRTSLTWVKIRRSRQLSEYPLLLSFQQPPVLPCPESTVSQEHIFQVELAQIVQVYILDPIRIQELEVSSLDFSYFQVQGMCDVVSDIHDQGCAQVIAGVQVCA